MKDCPFASINIDLKNQRYDNTQVPVFGAFQNFKILYVKSNILEQIKIDTYLIFIKVGPGMIGMSFRVMECILDSQSVNI